MLPLFHFLLSEAIFVNDDGLRGCGPLNYSIRLKKERLDPDIVPE